MTKLEFCKIIHIFAQMLKSMKKVFLLAAMLFGALVFSCKKENPGSDSGNQGHNTNPDPPASEFVEVTGIDVPSSFSLAINSAPATIKIALSPDNASLNKDVEVTCEQPETAVIEWSLVAEGINITPKSIGEAKFIIHPKKGKLSGKTCKVTVTQKPAEPASVSIVKTDSHFLSDGALHLAEGESFQLESRVINDFDAVTSDFPVAWSIVKGDTYISLDSKTGTIQTKDLGGATNAAAIVRVEVEGHSELSDEVSVKIQPLPTGISLSGEYLNKNNERLMKVGSKVVFTINPVPYGAIEGFEATSSKPGIASVKVEDDKLTVEGLARNAGSVDIVVKSSYAKDVKTTFKVYVFDYERTDTKPGDYVYYSDNMYVAVDCGLRYAAGSNSKYEASDGTVSNTPQSPTNMGVFKYIGVVVTTDVPSSFDMDKLNGCKDEENAAGLYEFRTFSRSNLPGFYIPSSAHALVLKKDQSPDKVEWQHNNEYIAATEDKQNGSNLWQFQLYGRYVFSPETKEYAKQWTGFGVYCSDYGLLSYLLLKFYNNHLNNHNYDVLPVKMVDAYSDIPKISSGDKSISGWYLPSKWEFDSMKANLAIINASLLKTGATQLSGDYWSTEEESEYEAFCYTVSGSNVHRCRQYKDTRTHSNGSAYVRAVMCL